jgi:hypothetical protein
MKTFGFVIEKCCILQQRMKLTVAIKVASKYKSDTHSNIGLSFHLYIPESSQCYDLKVRHRIL